MARYALCVGINDYPDSGADLKGCVNDARDWSALLSGLGYETVTLLDGNADKASVKAALLSLVARAKFGDRIVFTYSGHGSFVADSDGDEPDHRDECLVLHDYKQGGLLTDDELHTIFQARRFGVRVYVFSDSCHSGTVARFAGLGEGFPRFLPPVAFLDGEALARARSVQNSAQKGSSRPGTALISGCADNEYSYDAYINGKACGAFTSAAMTTYRPGITLRQWHEEIRRILPSTAYPQTPNLSASSWQRRWSL